MNDLHLDNMPAEVVPTLTALYEGARAVLGDRFAGMYVYGSLASGDFDPRSSDIDFMIATDGELPDDVIAALEALHRRLWADGGKWAAKLEGSYVPRQTLRKFDPNHPPRPGVNEERFLVEQHGSDWIIQRHLIRKSGIALAGPAPRELIDPVHPDDLRRAVLGTMHEWWIPMLGKPDFLTPGGGYQVFAVQTMCRVLYTVEHGEIASKRASVRWAREALGDPWRELLEQAQAWQPGDPFDHMDEVLAMIRFTAERAGISVDG